MLFEGAIRFLERAEGGFGIDDPAEANQAIHNNIQRTQEILHELRDFDVRFEVDRQGR